MAVAGLTAVKDAPEASQSNTGIAGGDYARLPLAVDGFDFVAISERFAGER